MHCQKCGKELTGDPRFCSSCGAPVTERTRPRNPRYTPRRLRLAAWIVWGLLFAALLAFIAIANLIGSEGAGGFDNGSLIRYSLYVIGAIVLIVAFLLRWAFRKWIRSTVLRDFLVIVIPGALCVALGIYGLIIFTTNADLVSLYVLVGIAAISLMFMRPSGKVG